jgi:4-diphosphocytidyl-2-C-methyl-D-erythritol kinase
LTPLRLDAPAKLNLSLAITGQRPDGFHELISDMILLELSDRLLLMPGSTGLRIEGTGAADLPAADDNLAWRGLAAGLEHPAELECLTLEKRIPVAAGLGGGSSDAAAAWRLARRWRGAGEEATAEDLLALSRLGADVPFFAAGVVAGIVSGIGEVVRRSEPPKERDVVLVHPPFGLSTARVFAELRRGEWSGTPQGGRNDLLPAAHRLRPELDDVVRLVAGAGGDPRLSGSGPTIYSLTDDPERATAVAARLERAGLRASLTRVREEPASIEAIEPIDDDPQQE